MPYEGPIAIESPATCRVPHTGYRLSNGVKVIVIQDVDTQKSTAAMGIRTGTHCDPPELPGLAHLCEHMLFLGTTEYPEEGAYHRFVSQNGGHSNAWTEDESTQYYFNSSNQAFAKGLAMFLHFFVSPLFSASALEREVEAVHSEDEKNHSSDYWCSAEIRKLHLANKQHPESRYGNGNKATLWDDPQRNGVDVRAMLLEFYEKYYVAENACVCVYTPMKPDDVLAIIEPILSRMRNGERSVHSFAAPPYVIDERDTAAWHEGRALRPGTWTQIKTSRAEQRLMIEFPIPYSHRHYESKPAAYASHVLGHECEGSLLAVLKHEGLAESLSAGAGHGVDDEFDRFSITVGLTAMGVRRLEQVIALTFQAITHMRREGVIGWVADEMKACYEVAFNLAEVEQPSQHASYCCRHANRYSIERCLSGPHKVFRRDDAAAAKAFEYLTPFNCFFILQLQDVNGAIDAASQELTAGIEVPRESNLALPVLDLPCTATRTTLVSRHHKAHFGIGIVEHATLSRWAAPEGIHPKLATPTRNPFLATNFDTAPLSDEKYPSEVKTPHGRMFGKRDSRFGIPKGFLAVVLESPLAYSTPLHRFFVRVAVKVAKHKLTETLYFAELGALHGALTPATNGIEVDFTGPSEKLLVFAEHVLRTVLDPATYADDEQAYNVYAMRDVRELLGNYVGQPYTYATEQTMCWLHKVRYSFTEVLDAAIGPHRDLPNVSATAKPPPYAEFVAFTQKLFSKVYYEAMWLGNAKEDYAAKAGAMIECLLSNAECCDKKDLTDQQEIVLLPSRGDLIATPLTPLDYKAPGWACVIQGRTPNVNDGNDAAYVMFQCGTRTPRQRVLADCAMALVNSLFFETLRTVETLGYIVGSGAKVMHQTVGCAFVAQSASQDAHYLLTRIHAFIAALPEHYRTLPDDEIASVIESQKAQRQDHPKSINEEGTTHWARRDNPYGFGYRELELAELDHVTREDICNFVDEYISNDSVDARAICAVFFSKEEPLEKFRTHTEVEGLKDLEPVRIQLLPKRTPATGKEEIALPDYHAGLDFLTLYHLEPDDRDAFREARSIVRPPLNEDGSPRIATPVPSGVME
jgi:insulysin